MASVCDFNFSFCASHQVIPKYNVILCIPVISIYLHIPVHGFCLILTDLGQIFPLMPKKLMLQLCVHSANELLNFN